MNTVIKVLNEVSQVCPFVVLFRPTPGIEHSTHMILDFLLLFFFLSVSVSLSLSHSLSLSVCLSLYLSIYIHIYIFICMYIFGSLEFKIYNCRNTVFHVLSDLN